MTFCTGADSNMRHLIIHIRQTPVRRTIDKGYPIGYPLSIIQAKCVRQDLKATVPRDKRERISQVKSVRWTDFKERADDLLYGSR